MKLSPTVNTLHTLNASTREQRDLLARLLRMASPGDSLLLIGNGVYSITDAQALQAFSYGELTVYCLQADLQARGLVTADDSINVVDDSGFVALACSHRKVVSWFL